MEAEVRVLVEMAVSRDRTSEFIAIADRLRKASSSQPSSSYGSLNGSHAAGNGETAPSSGSNSVASEFNKRASQIGLSIHQTSQKLSKLAKCEWLSYFREALSCSF